VIVKNIIENDASTSLQKIKTELENNAFKFVSTSKIHRLIDPFEYSFKRIQLIPIRRNEETTNIYDLIMRANNIGIGCE
jgi:hypothetical protein